MALAIGFQVAARSPARRPDEMMREPRVAGHGRMAASLAGADGSAVHTAGKARLEPDRDG